MDDEIRKKISDGYPAGRRTTTQRARAINKRFRAAAASRSQVHAAGLEGQRIRFFDTGQYQTNDQSYF
jgi:hypothetical protein